jgi:anti-sigma B factor antagonist
MNDVSLEWVTFGDLRGADLVRLVGEIDMANAPAIGRAVTAQIAAAKAVLVDLTAVSFLDSAGVRLLDELVGALGAQGIPIRLVAGPTGPVRMTLRLCAFREDLLDDDLDAAADAVCR